MSFYYLFIFILGVIYLINSDYQIYNKAMSENLEDLVIELGGGMRTSHRIEHVGVEACIYKNKVGMVYLWEGSLLPFMEGMEKHDEYISM